MKKLNFHNFLFSFSFIGAVFYYKQRQNKFCQSKEKVGRGQGKAEAPHHHFTKKKKKKKKKKERKKERNEKA